MTRLRAARPSPFLLMLVLVAVTGASPARADLGAFVIDEFHTDLTVLPNADLIVEERIVVEFSQPRRGIYRDVLHRYTDPSGYQYSLGFKLLDVVDDSGNKHRTKVTRKGRHTRIRIGDPDRTRTGRVVYRIRYRIRDGLGSFDQHDELYWNATGNQWRVPMNRVSATIRLPHGFQRDEVELAGYTGVYGSTQQNVEISEEEPGVYRVTARNRLNPFEGLTVVAAWPPGRVQFPSRLAVWGRRVVDNGIVIAPFLAFGWLLRKYRRSGRDPEGLGSVVVRYEPPENMTPAEVGTLIDETVDMRDITATVVDLAVRGHLHIRMEERRGFLGFGGGEEPVFERASADRPLNHGAQELHPHERLVLNAVFETGERVELKDLRNKFYKKLPGIKDAVFTRLTELGHFDAKPPSVRGRYVGLGFAFGLLTAAAGVAWLLSRGAVMPHALIVPLAAGAAVVISFIGFSAAMPRRSASGVKLREWALGFQEFVDRVETEQLERDRARKVFETLLPYAMALGVAEKWAREFEGIYKGSEAPAWYSSGRGDFSTMSLHDGLSSAMTTAARSMATAPRSSGSSGSGGGGFSGGGGGGGGGGSW